MTLSTPLATQAWYSESVIAREAPVMSGVFGPTPPQKICMPPPVPVELDDRARRLPVMPANCSATAWV